MRAAILLSVLALALIGAGPAPAQPVRDWSQATGVEVDLWNFKIDPDRIDLQAGKPYVLHFVNKSDDAHNFTAKAFFKGAEVAPEDQGAVKNGAVDLKPNSTLDVRIVAPVAGEYEDHCSHFGHALLGMKGKIVVQ